MNHDSISSVLEIGLVLFALFSLVIFPVTVVAAMQPSFGLWDTAKAAYHVSGKVLAAVAAVIILCGALSFLDLLSRIHR